MANILYGLRGKDENLDVSYLRVRTKIIISWSKSITFEKRTKKTYKN